MRTSHWANERAKDYTKSAATVVAAEEVKFTWCAKRNRETLFECVQSTARLMFISCAWAESWFELVITAAVVEMFLFYFFDLLLFPMSYAFVVSCGHSLSFTSLTHCFRLWIFSLVFFSANIFDTYLYSPHRTRCGMLSNIFLFF